MSYKGVIFDLDGTLLNSLEDIADAANATLEKHRLKPHPIDSYRYFIGDGLQILIERIVPEQYRKKEKITMLMETFKEFYQDNWYKKSRPYDGIKSMLDTLLNRGVKLAVFSNKPHHFTELTVKWFFPFHIFSWVQGQKDTIPKKPDPAGALFIAEQLGMNSGQFVFVGDSANDMKTGKSAGMKTIGVEWGFRDRTELQENGADKIVCEPSEIVDFVLNGE